MSEWRDMTLGSIATQDGYGLVDGPFGSNLPASLYTEGGIPVIRGSNLSLGTSRFKTQGFVFVSHETAKRFERSLCRSLDIVFTKKGTLGQTGLIPEGSKYEHYLLSSNQMKLTVDRDIADPLYVYYFVSSPESTQKIIRDADTTGVPKTNVAYLRKFPIRLPTVPTQRAIASVLGTLDDKIEQNRRTAQALEKLARAIFRAWFVDFEPVKTKAARATSFPSMPQAVFDALPTTFADSDIGPVPEGWDVKPLSECVWLTMGQSPSSDYYNKHGEGMPFHQGVTDYGSRFPTHRVFCAADGRRADCGDVLVSVRAPVGRINVADRSLILGRGLAGLRHRHGRQSFLLYQVANIFAVEDSMGEGTVYRSVTKKFLSQLSILSPPEAFQEAFQQIAEPMDALIGATEKESTRLAEMRDYLLPKLLSGEVRVRVAEQLAVTVA